MADQQPMTKEDEAAAADLLTEPEKPVAKEPSGRIDRTRTLSVVDRVQVPFAQRYPNLASDLLKVKIAVRYSTYDGESVINVSFPDASRQNLSGLSEVAGPSSAHYDGTIQGYRIPVRAEEALAKYLESQLAKLDADNNAELLTKELREKATKIRDYFINKKLDEIQRAGGVAKWGQPDTTMVMNVQTPGKAGSTSTYKNIALLSVLEFNYADDYPLVREAVKEGKIADKKGTTYLGTTTPPVYMIAKEQADKYSKWANEKADAFKQGNYDEKKKANDTVGMKAIMDKVHLHERDMDAIRTAAVKEPHTFKF
jgi:hypothetical protein